MLFPISVNPFTAAPNTGFDDELLANNSASSHGGTYLAYHARGGIGVCQPEKWVVGDLARIVHSLGGNCESKARTAFGNALGIDLATMCLHKTFRNCEP